MADSTATSESYPIWRSSRLPWIGHREGGPGDLPAHLTLEKHALSSAPPLPARISELRGLIEGFRDERDPIRAIELDRRWDEKLLERYENRSCTQIVGALKLRAARYEHAYMRDQARIEASAEQHHEQGAGTRGHPVRTGPRRAATPASA